MLKKTIRRAVAALLAANLAMPAIAASGLPPAPAVINTDNSKILLRRLRLAAEKSQLMWRSWAGSPTTLTGAAGGAAATLSGSVATTSVTATLTTSGTGYIATISAPSGTIYAGAAVTGTSIPAGTVISRQVSGSPGAAGVYVLNQAPTNMILTPASVTISDGVLTASSVAGTISAGDQLIGPSLPAAIVRQITGASGGAGTYLIDRTGSEPGSWTVTGSQSAPIVTLGSATPTIYASASAATVSGTTLTVTTAQTASFAVGQNLTAPGCAGVQIAALGTGTGGAGTYTITNPNSCAVSGGIVTAGRFVVDREEF